MNYTTTATYLDGSTEQFHNMTETEVIWYLDMSDVPYSSTKCDYNNVITEEK